MQIAPSESAARRCGLPWPGETPWERRKLHPPVFMELDPENKPSLFVETNLPSPGRDDVANVDHKQLPMDEHSNVSFRFFNGAQSRRLNTGAGQKAENL